MPAYKLAQFLEDQEPFLTFQRESKSFLEDRGVRYALRLLHDGILPNGFKWSNWDEETGYGIEERFAITGRVRRCLAVPRRATQ